MAKPRTPNEPLARHPSVAPLHVAVRLCAVAAAGVLCACLGRADGEAEREEEPSAAGAEDEEDEALDVVIVPTARDENCYFDACIMTWVDEFDDPLGVFADAIDVDGDGNVYVAGEAEGRSGFVRKYSPDGELLWSRPSPGGAKISGLDVLGDRIVSGLFEAEEGVALLGAVGLPLRRGADRSERR